MCEAGSSRWDLTPPPPATTRPSDLWPGSPLSFSPPGPATALGSGPGEQRPSSPTGCASTEMENVKGTFLRSLTAKKNPLQLQSRSSLSSDASEFPPGWGLAVLFGFNASGGRFNPLSLLLWFGF